MNEIAKRLFNDGTYLVTIEYYGHNVNLYSMDGDYYEVYYNKIDNSIEKVNLATEEVLKKYLNRIDLNGLNDGKD